MGAGNLVGDDIMIGIVEERLGRQDASAGSCSTDFPATVVRRRRSTGCMGGRGRLVVLNMVVPE